MSHDINTVVERLRELGYQVEPIREHEHPAVFFAKQNAIIAALADHVFQVTTHQSLSDYIDSAGPSSIYMAKSHARNLSE